MKLRAPAILMFVVLTLAFPTLAMRSASADVGADGHAPAARIPEPPSDSPLRTALGALLRERERRLAVLSPDGAAVSPEAISGPVLAEASLSTNGGRIAAADGLTLDFAPGSVMKPSPIRISRSDAPPPNVL